MGFRVSLRQYSAVSYVYQCVGCDTFAFQPIGRVTQTSKFKP